MNSQPILSVNNLDVTIGDKKIIENVSFSIEPEEVLAIIGPNGAGKSLLLKTLLGEIKPSNGTIKWQNDIRIGYLPQRFNVDRYLPMTIKEFLSLKPNPLYSLDDAAKLVKFGTGWQQKNLAHLSGGEMQKVLLAWTIIDKPQILLFDEPTENVDIVGQESIYNLLHTLQDELHIALIIVSHDLHAIYKYANKVMGLNKKIVYYGAPHTALTNEKLTELYGNHTFIHHHHTE